MSLLNLSSNPITDIENKSYLSDRELKAGLPLTSYLTDRESCTDLPDKAFKSINLTDKLK